MCSGTITEHFNDIPGDTSIFTSIYICFVPEGSVSSFNFFHCYVYILWRNTEISAFLNYVGLHFRLLKWKKTVSIRIPYNVTRVSYLTLLFISVFTTSSPNHGNFTPPFMEFTYGGEYFIRDNVIYIWSNTGISPLSFESYSVLKTVFCIDIFNNNSCNEHLLMALKSS
jgi:hypothetical protein